VNDPLIARFAEACGAAHPLNLRVGVVDGGVLTEGSVQQPFTLLGRDDACDVTLSDKDVNPRHAWFQVVDGRVYALDLGSRTGLIWPDNRRRSGWLDVDTPVRMGSFRVQLRSPVSQPTGQPGPEPVNADPNLARSRPTVQLDFRNGKRAKDRWIVNRIITLIGRSDACKLHLQADDISSYHCGLVLTPSGLWVVDLSGRGVVVNGERMRVAPLTHGAELWVGRFLIGCHYPDLGDTPSAGRPSSRHQRPKPATGKSPRQSASGMPTRPAIVSPIVAEDEVPLGGMPVHDPASGLPSSHILCDAFQVPASGPISAPIFVTGAGPSPPSIPLAKTDWPAALPPRAADSQPPVPLADDPSVAPLLKHLSEINGQLFEQFQQSLGLMAKLFGRVEIGDSRAMLRELSRIQELNVELARLQADMVRRSYLEIAAPQRPTSSDPTPLPGTPPLGGTRPIINEAIQEYVEQKIKTWQKERSHRWEKLNGLVSGDSREHEPLRTAPRDDQTN
jgi:pSer/pThr/pTyr-binding forkhead associated (FHA) protein